MSIGFTYQSGSHPNRESMILGSNAIDRPKPTNATTTRTGTSHNQSRTGKGRTYAATGSPESDPRRRARATIPSSKGIKTNAIARSKAMIGGKPNPSTNG